MQVEEASALEDTLARLRQRYALHFYLPEGAQSVDLQSVQVDLSQQARIRYQNAEVRSRRVFISGSGSNTNERAGTTVVTRTQPTADVSTEPAPSSTITDDTTPKRRRMAVNDSSGPQVNTVNTDSDSSSGSSQQVEPAATPKSGGWPHVNQQSTKP